jgi:hypothetical protein
MPRSSIFLREQRKLVPGTSGDEFVVVKSSLRLQAKGFHVVGTKKPAKSPTHQEDSEQLQYAQFLAEHAQKHPDKLIPFTADMLAKAKSLLKGVELDAVE